MLLTIFKKYKAEIIVTAVFMFLAFGFNVYRVQSDGIVHFRLIERMLNIPDPEQPIGTVRNAFFLQGGCAFFNAVFYLLAYAVEKIFHINFNFNGITLRQISINLASNFYMVLSLILSVRILRQLKCKHIVLPVLSILFSTSAFTTAVIQPSFSHSVDIFIHTSLLYLLLRDKEKPAHKLIWLGALCALAIFVRYFNFILPVSLLLYFFFERDFKRMKFFLIGFLGIVWALPLIFYTFNNTLSPLYRSEGLSFAFPKYMLKLLIHPVHGLFIWSPITILSAIGLIIFRQNNKRMGNLLIGIWILFVVMYGFTYGWHSGWSFSNRYLVSLSPIYIIGLSYFLDRYGKKMILLTSIMVIYSLILFLCWHQCIIHPEFGTPGEMIRAIIEKESISSFDGNRKVSWEIVLNRLWEMCRYKYLFK